MGSGKFMLLFLLITRELTNPKHQWNYSFWHRSLNACSFFAYPYFFSFIPIEEPNCSPRDDKKVLPQRIPSWLFTPCRFVRKDVRTGDINKSLIYEQTVLLFCPLTNSNYYPVYYIKFLTGVFYKRGHAKSPNSYPHDCASQGTYLSPFPFAPTYGTGIHSAAALQRASSSRETHRTAFLLYAGLRKRNQLLLIAVAGK